MSLEGQHRDQKSLRTVTGLHPQWNELAKDCVCFANAQGGKIAIGIEDGQSHPPVAQTVALELINRVRNRIAELTVNVTTAIEHQTSPRDRWRVSACDRFPIAAARINHRRTLLPASRR